MTRVLVLVRVWVLVLVLVRVGVSTSGLRWNGASFESGRCWIKDSVMSLVSHKSCSYVSWGDVWSERLRNDFIWLLRILPCVFGVHFSGELPPFMDQCSNCGLTVDPQTPSDEVVSLSSFMQNRSDLLSSQISSL